MGIIGDNNPLIHRAVSLLTTPCTRPILPHMGNLKRLSPTHEAIMDWILLNPGATLAECAAYFNYTPQGIGYIVNSDLFQARLRERRDQIEALIAADIPARMRVLGQLAIERTTEVLNTTNDPELIVDIFDKTLHRLGYGPQRGGSNSPSIHLHNQQVTYVASPEDIAQAQQVMLRLGEPEAIQCLVPPAALPREDEQSP